ncbi:MAG TPA: hypothetical protein VGC55_07665 [Dokdonella sp.]
MKLRVTIASLLLLYALYVGVMYAKQATILFPGASPQRHAFAGRVPPGAELVELPVSFGKARAIFWRAGSAATPAPAIWFAHGNYETVETSFELVQPLVARGIAVLQLEFPGYDGADGMPTADTIAEAAGATWNWLAQRSDVDATRLVAMGYSVGGGPAAEIAAQRHARALVLLSTYSSLADMANHLWLPGSILDLRYDNVARVRAFDGPVFVEHGRHDEVIPFRFGERTAAARPGIEFLALDCGHADCHFDRSVFAAPLPDWLTASGVIASSATPAASP